LGGMGGKQDGEPKGRKGDAFKTRRLKGGTKHRRGGGMLGSSKGIERRVVGKSSWVTDTK